jgi:hypothetical protein
MSEENFLLLSIEYPFCLFFGQIDESEGFARPAPSPGLVLDRVVHRFRGYLSPA